MTKDRIEYTSVTVAIDRGARSAAITLVGSRSDPPADASSEGSDFWPLRMARELDDVLLHLRVNELEIGTIILKSVGDLEAVLAYDEHLRSNGDNWFVREVSLLWARVLRRVDLTSRTIIALIEPNSCFGGFLADLTLAADRPYMLIGTWGGDGGH